MNFRSILFVLTVTSALGACAGLSNSQTVTQTVASAQVAIGFLPAIISDIGSLYTAIVNVVSPSAPPTVPPTATTPKN